MRHMPGCLIITDKYLIIFNNGILYHQILYQSFFMWACELLLCLPCYIITNCYHHWLTTHIAMLFSPL